MGTLEEGLPTMINYGGCVHYHKSDSPQHDERPTRWCRPVVEDRTFSKRCRVASSHGSRSSLPCGNGGDVRQSAERGVITICSPSGESSDAASSVHVDSHEGA